MVGVVARRGGTAARRGGTPLWRGYAYTGVAHILLWLQPKRDVLLLAIELDPDLVILAHL
jgi:hypothetical protein